MTEYQVTLICAQGRFVRPVIAANGPLAICTAMRTMPRATTLRSIKSKQVPHAR